MTEQAINNKPIVVKVGGALLEKPEAVERLFQEFQGFLAQSERSLVLVHGGGCLVDELLSKMNLTSDKIDGLRVTPFDQIDYIAGALAGTANKHLLAQSLQAQLKGVGLCLSDAGMCRIEQLDERLGAVGVGIANDASLIKNLLEGGFFPVISSIGIGDDGRLYNVNGDQAALVIAQLLQAELVLLSDVEGVLDGDMKLIPELSLPLAEKLIDENVIRDGMAVKVKAAFDAASTIGGTVYLASWKSPEKLVAMLNGEAAGTKVSC